jgi:hypothetical protein
VKRTTQPATQALSRQLGLKQHRDSDLDSASDRRDPKAGPPWPSTRLPFNASLSPGRPSDSDLRRRPLKCRNTGPRQGAATGWGQVGTVPSGSRAYPTGQVGVLRLAEPRPSSRESILEGLLVLCTWSAQARAHWQPRRSGASKLTLPCGGGGGGGGGSGAAPLPVAGAPASRPAEARRLAAPPQRARGCCP